MKYAIALVGCLVFWYLVFAFVLWQPIPENWNEGARLLLVLVSLIAFAVVSTKIYLEEIQ